MPPPTLWQCFECLAWNPDKNPNCRRCDLPKAASGWREETLRIRASMTDEWNVPIAEPKPKVWVCTNCGSEGAAPISHEVFGSFTQFDKRYTMGYCDTCSDPNPKKPRKTPRPTHRIVLLSAFNREEFERRKDMERLGALVRQVSNSGSNVQLAEQDAIALVSLFDQYGYAGFRMPESIRDGVEKHLERASVREAAKPKKVKRGR